MTPGERDYSAYLTIVKNFERRFRTLHARGNLPNGTSYVFKIENLTSTTTVLVQSITQEIQS